MPGTVWVLHTSTYLSLISLRGFTGEGTEAETGEVACLIAHNQWQSQDSSPGIWEPSLSPYYTVLWKQFMLYRKAPVNCTYQNKINLPTHPPPTNALPTHFTYLTPIHLLDLKWNVISSGKPLLSPSSQAGLLATRFNRIIYLSFRAFVTISNDLFLYVLVWVKSHSPPSSPKTTSSTRSSSEPRHHLCPVPAPSEPRVTVR